MRRGPERRSRSRVLGPIVCLVIALAGVGEGVAGTETCDFSVPMYHGYSYLNCADMNEVSAFAYALAEPKINIGSARIAYDHFNTGNFLGDHVVSVQADWGNPGNSGCPLTASGPGRVIVIVVGSDGSSAVLSVSGSTAEFGYLLDAAHSLSDGGEVMPLACGSPTTRAAVFHSREKTVDVYLATPRIYSDCDPGSLGRQAYASGSVAIDPCFDQFAPRPHLGEIYTTIGRCASTPDIRKGRWLKTGVFPDADGRATVPYTKTADASQCMFVGSTVVIAGRESEAIVGFVRTGALPANSAPSAILEITPNYGPPPLVVLADASKSTDTDYNAIARYTFDFGDGTPLVGPQSDPRAEHTYTAAGKYSAVISVVDSAGLSSRATASVTVDPEAPSDPPEEPPLSLLDDGIELLVAHGATSSQAVLTWTGGAPPFEVFRSTDPANVIAAANKLAEAVDSTWTDVPPAAGAHFYLVVERGNQPPDLSAIGAKTAPLGQTLTFTVAATDPNPDPVLLTVTPLPLPDHAEFDGTTGEFLFRPTTEQVGTIDLTFIASDGELTDSETITITVPAPQTGVMASLSGRVLDANSAANGFTVPIVGATISFLGTNRSAMSGAQGFFTVTDVPAGQQVLDIATATAQAAPDGSPYAGFREAIQIIGAVENIVSRPFFLPRIDINGSETVIPAGTTEVINPDIFGDESGHEVILTIPPHTAKYQDGTDFDGEISISLVPRGFAPAELPPFLDPALLVTIQPVGVFFATPVPLTFPNLDSMPAGNGMELWSLLATEGRFAVVGEGDISADGQRIETVMGGVRAADWHLFAPPQTVASGPPSERRCGQCPNGPEESQEVGSAVGLAEGALQERHSLPGVRSMGIPRTLTLAYDSTTADVRPIVGLDTTLPMRAAVPQQFSLSFRVGGVTQGATAFYGAASLPDNSDSTSRLVARFDASSLPTGRYTYQADIFSRYDSSRVGSFVTDNMVVVNRQQSPVGTGWGFAGLQRLHPQSDGRVLLTDGDGSALVFTPRTSGVFQATGMMERARGVLPAMTRLQDGRVLITGGFGPPPVGGPSTVTAAAEIFDPQSGTWTPTGAMNTPRTHHTATLLADGRVLIAGGTDVLNSSVLSAPEIYNPETGVFTGLTNDMTRVRRGHSATLLGNGMVLLAGGVTNNELSTSSAELFNPVTGTFAQTNGPMVTTHFDHTATLLLDGRVLIAGGMGFCQSTANNAVEIFDPGSSTFTLTPPGLATPRSGHRAVLLADGRVLISGGAEDSCTIEGLLDTAEIFDPVAGSTQAVSGLLCSKKTHHVMGTLPDGRVVIAGGWHTGGSNDGSPCASLYDPTTNTLSPTDSMSTGRAEPAAVVLEDGGILVAGGNNTPGTYVQSAEVFRIQTAEDGVFLAPAGDFTTLQQHPDGTFTRTYRDQTKLRFNAAGLETSVEDRNGNITMYGYGVGGRLESMTDPKSQVWNVMYDGSGKLQSITDPALRTTSFTHDARGDLIRITKTDEASVSYSYDPQHRLTRRTDERGNEVIYAYDFAGRLLSASHPEGEVRQLQPVVVQGLANLASGVGTVGNPAPIVASGSIVATVSDGNGHPGFITLNRFGSAIRREDAIGRVTQIVRDADNLPRQVTRPNLSVVTMTYDTVGNLLTSTEEHDPNGPAPTTFTYEPVFNQVDSIRDARLNLTTIDHDGQGNPTKITDARMKETILTWLPGGLLETVKPPQVMNPTRFGYDSLGNLNKITNPLPLPKVTDIVNNDAGNVMTVTDPRLHLTQYDYDEQNRLIEVIDAAMGHTKYVYDAKGNLRFLTDARTKTTEFEYNARDLVKTITNPLGQSRTLLYDFARNLRFADDAKGQQIEFLYDHADQLTTKNLRDSNQVVTDTASFTYDDLGNLKTASDGDSSLTSMPDPLGRVSTVVTGGMQPATTVGYTYDKNGNRKTMTDPQGFETIYDYDELNRLMTLTSHQGVFTFGNDDASRRESLGYPNGVSIDYDHDNANQLTVLHLLDSDMNLLSKYDYTYDDAGNRETRTTLDGVTTYAYDALDRLTDSVGPDPANPLLTLTESYDYDPVGNRTSSHLATGQAHDDANRLLEDSQFIYAYDANGNLASKQDKVTSEITTYDWSVEDRLVAVHTPSHIVTFRYDALARRIESAGAVTTRYVYDQEDIIEERNGSNALTLRNVHGPGIDEPLARRDVVAGQTAFLHVDGLGSITDSTDSAGQISAAHRYDSYGNVFVGAGSNGHAFTGREWDAETHLLYYRARYYDPKAGRFLSEDPIGLFGGANLYRYVTNNPVSLVDPLGLTSMKYRVSSGRLTIDPEVPGSAPYTIAAASGKGGCMNEPKCATRVSEGPIPGGGYGIDTSLISAPGKIGILGRYLRTGLDWGSFRVPITALSPTNTHGRSGFYLHGGRFPGTGGCIDAGGGLFGNADTKRLIEDMLADPDGFVSFTVVE